MTQTAVVTDPDGDCEELTVSKAERYHFESEDETGWCLLGIDPYDSELLDSDLKWMSGSMASSEQVRTTEDGEPKFPAVYVPDDYHVEIAVVEE